MEWYWAALILFGLGVGLMMLGVPVAIAFFATNIVAAVLFMVGGPAGSSMGACALLGSLMVPEMMRRGYSKYLSIGPIMGVGGLAVIIPPSALTVLLATLGRTAVADLLIAGVVPGLVLAAMYGVLIWLWTVIDPAAAPMYDAGHVSRREKLR